MPNELEGRDVQEWRFECLEKAGFDTEAALLLAEDSSVDHHAAIALLAAGATADEILRILL